MDPYLFLPTHADDDLSSLHLHVLKVMEIVLAVGIEEGSGDLRVTSIDSRTREQGITHRATLAITSLLSEIAGVSRTLLGRALTTVLSQQKNMAGIPFIRS